MSTTKGRLSARRLKTLAILAAVSGLTDAHFLVAHGTHGLHEIHMSFAGSIWILGTIGGVLVSRGTQERGLHFCFQWVGDSGRRQENENLTEAIVRAQVAISKCDCVRSFDEWI